MAEWLKAHAWKACVPQGTVGSNPTLSASNNPFQPEPEARRAAAFKADPKEVEALRAALRELGWLKDLPS
jgi:hypothetical protein